MYRAICQAWIPFLTYKKTRQNVAVTYMESFLSRVTGKTFPWVYWSQFDKFFHFLIQNCCQIV